MAVEIGKLGNPPRETSENKDTVEQIAGSSILILHLQGK
jgi:hypothetical protein